ncbi:hypothetical protein EG68_06339 [Paragonimus skrjabini miyazakii]|uniref:TATA element modulatory factor 1 TATA binding domain-containing protein n=1 Tax=Paragonimus skrjabini miyazakii TaxID=59628 RepID=A0A8S9YWT2_9TREM|nr:hypothetical protein EG68_06339 [Paragonimus skrjabini miyazakii]
MFLYVLQTNLSNNRYNVCHTFYLFLTASRAHEFSDLSVNRLHEPQLSGESDSPTPCDVRSVSPVHSNENPIPERISRPHTPTGILEVQNISTTPTGPPHSPTPTSHTEAFPVTAQYPSRFSKSCSEGDLSADTLSPIAVTPTRNLRVSVEEDVETTTTGSDIEVISCCTSTNGESLPVHYQASLSQAFLSTHSNDLISCLAGKTGRQFDASQLTVNIPAAFRGHSAPMASSHSCLRRHRRAVSQDYRFGHCGPNEEDLFFAFQRLSKSYSDKKHLLGVREAKILELSRENCELRDANALLQAQLKSEDSDKDLSSLTGEFSKRLAKTELQLRMVTRERDQLKASLAAAHSRIRPEKCTNSSIHEEVHLKKISELERCLQDKTNQLDDLLKEGEKLSQNQLKTNNVLKKLHKEKKEMEQRERNHMDKIEQLNASVEALQTNLHQKEDAIKELTVTASHFRKMAETRDDELENLKVQLLHSRSQIDEQKQELERVKRDLSVAVEDLTQTRTLAESQARACDNERSLQEVCQSLKDRLTSAQSEMASFKVNHERQAEQWREERNYYQNLLAENRLHVESMGDLATSAAQPVLLQLQAAESTLSQQARAWEQAEQTLNQRLLDAQREVQMIREVEQTYHKQLKTAEDRNSQLERHVLDLKAEISTLTNNLKCAKESSERLEKADTKLTVQLEHIKGLYEEQLSRVMQLESAVQSERKKVETLAKEKDHLISQLHHHSRKDSLSGTGLMLADAVDQSLNSDLSVDDRMALPDTIHQQIEERSIRRSGTSSSSSVTGSASPSTVKSVAILHSPTSNTQAALEYLQSLLNLKEGECNQLRRDVVRLTRAKESLLSEVASLSARAERLARLTGISDLPQDSHRLGSSPPDELEELQRRYDSLLLIYGKLTEENNELRLDLTDIKEMYRTQIDMLLRDPKKCR